MTPSHVSEVKREPSADMRQMANLLHQMHVALVDEGFTEQQAMAIIGAALAAQVGRGEA